MNSDELRREKHRHMTEAPIRGLILRMAAPTVVSMLITSVYNMADTFFVGRVGTSATGGVGVVFPLMAVIQAVGFFHGQGSGNYISRLLGSHRIDEASKMAATGFFSAFIVGTLVMIVGLLNLTNLCVLLGSTDTILPHARDYMRFILIGAPFMTSSLVLNNQLRLQGNATYAMVGIATGGVLNILLDPLFIFTFGMGTGGAALATAISQFISFCMLFAGCKRGGNVPIELRNFSPELSLYREIAKAGGPSLLRQMLASLATIALNVSAGIFGDAAIAAMSIVTRIMMFAFSALIGFGQGFQPVCGFNYGAKRYDRVLEAFWFCVKVGTLLLSVLALLGIAFAPEILALFRRDDALVIAIGSRALRMQCIIFPLLAYFTLQNMLMQNIGAFVQASVLATARQGLFFLPLILTLPKFFGLWGVIFCQPLADLFTVLLAIFLGRPVLSRLREASEGQKRATALQNAGDIS